MIFGAEVFGDGYRTACVCAEGEREENVDDSCCIADGVDGEVGVGGEVADDEKVDERIELLNHGAAEYGQAVKKEQLPHVAAGEIGRARFFSFDIFFHSEKDYSIAPAVLQTAGAQKFKIIYYFYLYNFNCQWNARHSLSAWSALCCGE